MLAIVLTAALAAAYPQPTTTAEPTEVTPPTNKRDLHRAVLPVPGPAAPKLAMLG
jgi:hypothetical protein